GQWGTVAESDIMVRWFFKTPRIFPPEVDAKLNQLVATAAGELDRDKRGKGYRDLARLAAGEAPWLFIHHQAALRAQRRDIPWQVLSGRGGKAHIYYFTLAPR